MNISPRFSLGEQAVPRVVVLRPVLWERTEDLPLSFWYLDFTCLRVDGDVSSDFYGRFVGTSGAIGF
jgi:hypothetical protein